MSACSGWSILAHMVLTIRSAALATLRAVLLAITTLQAWEHRPDISRWQATAEHANAARL